MAVSIDWNTRVITVPKADTVLVQAGPPEVREINMDNFRLSLHALQASEEGVPFPTIFEHTSPRTLGGIEFARELRIVNGYTVTFEDGSYVVNLEGGNNNILDVANLNAVSIRANLTAGLVNTGESGLTAEETAALLFLTKLLEGDQFISSLLHTVKEKGTENVIYQKEVKNSQLPSGVTVELTEPVP